MRITLTITGQDEEQFRRITSDGVMAMLNTSSAARVLLCGGMNAWDKLNDPKQASLPLTPPELLGQPRPHGRKARRK